MSAEPADIRSPFFVGGSGVTLHAFDDGGAAIIMTEGEHRTALHLNPEQAKQLAGFVRILHAKVEPSSILDEAREIVAGARQQIHGAPERNSEAIALVWSALLVDVLRPGARIGPAVVNLMMAGMKLVRASKDPGYRDHSLDVIGYVHLNEVCGYVNPK